MYSSQEAVLEKLQTILWKRFPFLKIELCWKTSLETSNRIPFLHIWKPIQMPNLRFLTYLPSFHLITTVRSPAKEPAEDQAKQTIFMHLITYQGRLMAKESFVWEWNNTPHFKLISQLANDSIGKLCTSRLIHNNTNSLRFGLFYLSGLFLVIV